MMLRTKEDDWKGCVNRKKTTIAMTKKTTMKISRRTIRKVLQIGGR